MIKVEAPTLEKAYAEAAEKLACSVTELDYEIVQYPSEGIFGIFKKNAVIVATKKQSLPDTVPQMPTRDNDTKSNTDSATPMQESAEETSTETSVEEIASSKTSSEDEIVDAFFEAENQETSETSEERALAYEIEMQLKRLMEVSCFDVDTVEVDVMENTAYVFIDGEDAALLIGKEGYRYNALSYMLFNWLHAKYGLFLKLEIASFLTSQEEMIRNYIKPVVENVKKYGKGKTRFLDGVLVQIALEQLRETFPDKYVAIKTAKSGKRFVVVNEFYHKER